uniref:Uncharacterized protein n=1 Tax=Steinernema glaseri TaxID=37863 RepID=A0A1I7ZRM7_9BILA
MSDSIPLEEGPLLDRLRLPFARPPGVVFHQFSTVTTIQRRLRTQFLVSFFPCSLSSHPSHSLEQPFPLNKPSLYSSLIPLAL